MLPLGNTATMAALLMMVQIFFVLFCWHFFHLETDLFTKEDGRESAATEQVKPSSSTRRGISRPNKYLKYGSTSGWANQLVSLEHAMWLADATRRTLILPPMLSHFEKIQWSYLRSTIDAEYEKITEYIPLTKVLDFDWSDLTVLDWNLFHEQTQGQNLTETELSYKYNCANTKWTRNLTAFSEVNLKKVYTCQDHIGREGFYNITYRDMVTTLEQFDSFDVLNFHFIFPPSAFDAAHQHPKFNLTYSEPIRTAAKSIRRQFWRNEPYASIHIRAGDGPYRKIFKRNATGVIRDALGMVAGEIEKYYLSHEKNLDHVPLLIITDLSRMRDHPAWLKESAVFSRNMADRGISLSYIFAADYEVQVKELMAKTLNIFADVCVDMQLAACATIGIGYYETNSTFLARINAMRTQPAVC